MSVLKPFFDIERFETRIKKYVHFLTDGVSVSVVLGEECESKPKAHKTKRKRGEEDDEPTVSSASYDVRVGLDPGLQFSVIRANTGMVQFAGGAGATVLSTPDNTFNKLAFTNSVASAYYANNNKWYILGDLLP